MEKYIRLWGGKEDNNNENNSAPANGRRGISGEELRKLETGERKTFAPSKRTEGRPRPPKDAERPPLTPRLNQGEGNYKSPASGPALPSQGDLSLSSLKKIAPKPESKKPSQKNLGELRSALASVLAQQKASPSQGGQEPKQKEEKRDESPQKNPSPEEKSKEPNPDVKPRAAEVPKDVLENILKVDESR